MNKEYAELIQKLDRFIRKYYQNLLIRGGIYFASATLLLFLIIIVLEYFGRYQSEVRAILFFSFVAITTFCLLRFVIIPLGKLYKLGSTLNYEQASQIIGSHFPEVKDKLLNVLQLQHVASKSDQSLLEAAIRQKTNELQPIPFATAINLNKNVKYLRYVVVPILLYAAIYVVAPSMISDGGKRVIYYNQTFKPVAPFTLTIENEKLLAQQYQDFELNVETGGAELPAELYIVLNENRYKMRQVDKTHFTYTFTNVQKSTPFQLLANDFYSEEYLLKTFAKPLIVNYRAKLEYPAYLLRKAEWIDNPADLTVPAGTTIKWEFNTANTNDVVLAFDGKALKATLDGSNRFVFQKKFFISNQYSIKTANAAQPVSDSMQYNITVVPDAFPSITMDERQDSASNKQLFFIGDANDDYGLTRLAFVYQIKRNGSEQPEPRKMQWLPIENGTQHRFYHQFNLEEIGIGLGDEVFYYMEVWDNDAVHGNKSSKSAMKQLRMATIEELEEKTDLASNALKAKMENAIKEAKNLQKEMKELERKMMDKRELTWEEKQKMEKMLQQQKELAKKLNEIKKEREKIQQSESEYQKQEEQILEKQKQLEKMFNELMDDEMKKLIKEMEQLLQNQNKDVLEDKMKEMQLNNKDVEKELDRMLEQYKKLELEKKMEKATEKLDELADKQEKLAKENKDAASEKQSKEEKNKQLEKAKEEQQDVNKEFKELQKELNEIKEENKKLEEPTELENTEKQEEEIEKEQEGSKEDLEKGDNKKASEKQQKAAQKMKEMSQKMKDKKAEQEEKELEMDAQALREILENTIQLSKDQEKLMDDMRTINGYNPQYVETAQKQKKVKDDAKIIEDSLLALSKRVAEIRSFVNREVTKLNENLDRSVKGFSDRNFMEIRTRQQYSMTHANNLAVMLSDVLKQMQDQMQGDGDSKGKGKPSKGSKGKKGSGSKPKSMSELKKAQEELNKQLREGLNKQPGKGEEKGDGDKKPGGQKPGGEQGQPGMGGMNSKEFARMAAQQQAIRQQMQKMLQQMGTKEKEGLGGQQKLQEMQRLMEQTEKELFNKKLSNEMLMRQQDILTRMLESEKAERKQEQEQKREAEQAKEKPATTPPSFEQYLKQKNKEQELLETIPAELQPYYKEKAKEYFKKVGGE